MLTDALLILSVLLNVLILAFLLIRKDKRTQAESEKVLRQFDELKREQERIIRAVREEMVQNREESNRWARELREETTAMLQRLSQALVRNIGESATGSHKATLAAIGEMSAQHKHLLDAFAKQLGDLTRVNEERLSSVRDTVEKRLALLQEDNSKKLEQMRSTVDEKLNETLEKRLGESFKLVSDRLEQVHKGLGEMQSLAIGVGDLKRVLTNVKSRGTLGEIQLENILEQILSPDQYEKNAVTTSGSAERVEFAIKLPGKEDSGTVLLPIDSKFPLEDYQRLLDAQDAGDLTAANEAAKLLEARIRQEAKKIQEKYVNPPNTTDFAIMFLPIEGLFAEVLRRSGLWEVLQREFRVIVTGPTTITALLNSLQMGFRTLAIQQRSSEVWQLLGAVKTEFSRFGNVLAKTQKKLQEASNTIDQAATRSRAIERKLRTVEEVSSSQAAQLLGEGEGEGDPGIDGDAIDTLVGPG